MLTSCFFRAPSPNSLSCLRASCRVYYVETIHFVGMTLRIASIAVESGPRWARYPFYVQNLTNFREITSILSWLGGFVRSNIYVL
jgi:hypothetical protein